MGIESQFGRGSMGQEGKESREDTASEIYFYASEHERTKEDRTTPQGSGYSTSLDAPNRTTIYHWEGRLHPTAHERQYPSSREGYNGSRNARDNVNDLAKNFSVNYLGTQNPELEKRGEASYTLSFDPSEEIVEQFQEQYKYSEAHGEKHRLRGLTEAEQEKFLEAFREANQEAVKKAKKK